MNLLGIICLVVTICYAVFLIIARSRMMRGLANRTTPIELYESCKNRALHHRRQAIISTVAVGVILVAKAILLVFQKYQNPGPWTKIAFGFGESSTGMLEAIGVVCAALILLAILEAISFVKYDSCALTIFVLRRELNLENQLPHGV